MKKIAKIISVLLHPLLMPTIMSGVFMAYAPSLLPIVTLKGQAQFILFIFLTTFIFPILSIYIYYLWVKGEKHEGHSTTFSKSLLMESKEERFIPFTITTALYALMTYFLIYKAQLPLRALAVVFGGITMCLALVTFISRFWKISAHSAGIAGGLGFLLGSYLEGEINLFYPIITFIILTGLLMSARLYLNSHNLLQVAIGGLTGFIICFGSMALFG